MNYIAHPRGLAKEGAGGGGLSCHHLPPASILRFYSANDFGRTRFFFPAGMYGAPYDFAEYLVFLLSGCSSRFSLVG